MTDPNEWQEGNARQLAAALGELRDRLERHAQRPSESRPSPASSTLAPATTPTQTVPAVKAGSRSLIQRLLRDEPTQAEASARPAPAEARTAPGPSPTQRRAEPPWSLHLMGERLGLTQFERNVLLLCAAMELDTRTAALCARAHDDPQKPFPTFALALALFEKPSWDVLSPERPLRYWRLIEINQPGGQPLTASALRADERIVNYLKTWTIGSRRSCSHWNWKPVLRNWPLHRGKS
jgi:hypothetical protein